MAVQAKARLTFRQADEYNPNLLDNSAFTKDFKHWTKWNDKADITIDDSVVSPVGLTRVLKFVPYAADQIQLATYIDRVLRPNTTYTFSVWIKQPRNYNRAVFFVNKTRKTWISILGNVGEWQKFVHTFTTPAVIETNTFLSLLSMKNANPDDIVYFAAPKLELGEVATSWTSSEADRKGDKGDKGDPGKNGQNGKSYAANLINNSAFAKNHDGWGTYGGEPRPVLDDSVASPVLGTRVFKLTNKPEGDVGVWHNIVYVLRPNTTYTMSVWVKQAAKRKDAILYVWNGSTAVGWLRAPENDGEWQHFMSTFTTGSKIAGNTVLNFAVAKSADGPHTAYFAAPKLEEGTIATPWTSSEADRKGADGKKGDKGDPGKPGKDGKDGRGIARTFREFYRSESVQEQRGGSWSETRPPWKADTWLWARDATAYTDGTKTYLSPVLVDWDFAEPGGLNFFGFKKNVQLTLLDLHFQAQSVLAPDINGVRTKVWSAPTNTSGNLFRLHGLGFLRAGWYTLSCEVRLVRTSAAPFQPASNSFQFHVCDTSRRFTLSTAWQRFEHTALVQNYFSPTEGLKLNGFVDLEALAGCGLAVGDVIEVRNLMVERGRNASAYAKCPEDVDWELSHTAYLREIFDRGDFATEGGAVFTSMLQICDLPASGKGFGPVTGYLNGYQSYFDAKHRQRPALALGVKNFGTAGETEEVALNFDGSGHLKNLYFNGAEEGFYMGADPNTALVKFSSHDMPTVPQLVADRTKSTTMKAETIVVEENPQTTYPKKARSVGTLRVESLNGRLKCRASLRVTGQAMNGPNRRPDVVVVIRFIGADGKEYYTHGLSNHYNVDGRVFEYNSEGGSLPVGTYHIEVTAYPSDVQNYRVEFKMLEDCRYTAIADRGVYGIYKNGVLAFENENRYAMMRDGQISTKGYMRVEGELIVKGKVDMPGVLVAGSVSGDDGRPTNYWGCKGRTSGEKAMKVGNGIYHIYHTIGHLNYSLMVTPHQKDTLLNPSASILHKYPDLVEFVIREGHTSRQASTDYDFVILGLN